MKRNALLLAAFCAFCGVSLDGAAARQHYAARYYQPPVEDPYVDPAPPAGFVFMRHSERCEYPNGWNTSDFSRNLNGVPRDPQELLATGCGSYVPLAD
ncbi:hypothetical protein [Beijerinckia sp. L45]|uniref:hypothetical protein n=1 Tax=Beijerinckia sp. L45 TaxID=1641855 RepID=UPI00131B6AD5|nr:hypothetical protein [Beijerinckia sp. L45]